MISALKKTGDVFKGRKNNMKVLNEAMKILLESKKESPWKIASDLSEYKCEARSNEIEVGEEEVLVRTRKESARTRSLM